MTIYRTAYDTAACRDYVMKRTTQALEDASAHGQLGVVGETTIRTVTGGSSVVDAIPAFAHPVEFNTHKPGQESLAVDLRPFGKYDTHQMTFNVRNPYEHDLALCRTKLNYIWIAERPAMLRDMSTIPLAVYASWISENVARRFALDPREQLNLAILAGIFYASLFSEDAEPEEREKLRTIGAISRALRVTAQDVMSVWDSINGSNIAGIGMFCEFAQTATGSVRLQELNPGLLVMILKGTWFGTNANETVAVAIEHPPTWIALLIAAFQERTFKNSGITRVAERIASKNSGQDFLRQVLNLIATVVD